MLKLCYLALAEVKLPSSPGRIRSFIAIELPLKVRKELAVLKKEIERDEYGFVRWVNVEGVHLTLKFLGTQVAGHYHHCISKVNCPAMPIGQPAILQYLK